MLNILLVEDDPFDAELTLAALMSGDVLFDATRVDNESDYRQNLSRTDLDLILSDYSLPMFSGTAALAIARDIRPDLPLIFVSGALGEDTAIEMLRDGATDYVLKQRLNRLVPAVTRAVAESRERSSRKRAEELVDSERHRAEVERERLLANERSARSDAERSSRLKDEFLATLSHELRTPLNAILGWSQILSSGEVSKDDLIEGMKTIERNARAQSMIIEDLLDMSRIISGNVRIEIRPVELVSLIKAAIENARPSADAKSIPIHADFHAAQNFVNADPHRLTQVMWNLLTNAVKFTPVGGRIRVDVERHESEITISVTDSGEGLRPDFLPFIFDRFRQADGSTTRRHGGLGLGLAIVKQLVELHGGSIGCSSDGLGKGATFTVTLPTGIVSLQDAPVTKNVPDARSFKDANACGVIGGIKALVVDDVRDTRDVISYVLRQCEVNVIEAGSAADAMERFRTLPFDILVSDIGMPGEDGFELIRQIRAFEAESGRTQLPSIALTAYARDEDRHRVMAAGFQVHMAKPVDAAMLLSTVASLLGRN